MSSKWRELEKLVAKIESALAPQGAIIKSPDKIPDLVTGSLREVDVSIRYKIGTTPVLITIECRRRKAIQDDTWMEQIATKKQKIGAAKTIAVSATGFSKPALKTARLYGIEVRRFQEIDTEDIAKWLNIAGIIQTIFYPILVTCEPQLYPQGEEEGGGDPILDPQVAELLNSDTVNAPVFILHSDNKAITINDMLRQISMHLPHNYFDDIPIDGTKVRRNLKIENPRGVMYIETTNGPRDIHSISLEFDYYAQRYESPVTEIRTYLYSDEKGPLVYRSDHTAKIFGQSMNLATHRSPGTNELIVTISKDDSTE